jgi:hypothetical protein
MGENTRKTAPSRGQDSLPQGNCISPLTGKQVGKIKILRYIFVSIPFYTEPLQTVRCYMFCQRYGNSASLRKPRRGLRAVGRRPVRSTGVPVAGSHHGGPGSSPHQVTCDLWWTQQVCSGYQSFCRLVHIRHNPSSGVGTVGQTVAGVSSGLSVSPPHHNPQRHSGNYPHLCLIPSRTSVYSRELL